MAPASFTSVLSQLVRRQSPGPIISDGGQVSDGDWRKAAENHPEDLIVESWSQGFIVGALIVMACITIANMRRGVILHKLILLELLLAMSHGTFCFMSFNGYGWYLSSTATLLYISWIIHNVVAWMKVKPFFIQPGGFFKAKTGLWVQRIYLGSLVLTVPVILFQVTDNFRFFNNYGGWYKNVRPYEPVFRDPWWIFTCLSLFHVIRKCYGTGVLGLIKRSPRFGILLSAIVLAIVFTVLDIIASIHPLTGTTDGINPWWKLSLVFKCLTDTIMLDDFKTELKRLGIKRIEKEEARRKSFALVSEYPSGLESPNSDTYSHPRRDTLFSFHRNNSSSRSGSGGPTMFSTPNHDSRDENEDPLSEYASQRELLNRSKKPTTNDPDTGCDEVEFATALNLSHDSISGAQNERRDSQPRRNIRQSTKKIGKLPGLWDFKFEAIKPGKKSRNRGDDDAVNDEKDNQHGDPQLRNMAEEIQRNTIMDLEAQRKQSLAEKAVIEDSDSGPKDDAELRRLMRFKNSIGAIE